MTAPRVLNAQEVLEALDSLERIDESVFHDRLNELAADCLVRQHHLGCPYCAYLAAYYTRQEQQR